jgi:Asp-tRNA(Asn)/Glu-tRNA(Gln) amidotransferase A subunit family amidase
MRILCFLTGLLVSFACFAQTQNQKRNPELVGNSVADTNISKSDISIAGKIMNLGFTAPELDSMYEQVLDQTRRIRSMQSLPLPNDVPMSLWHNPVLPKKKFTKIQGASEFTIPSTVRLPENRNDLAFYTISQLASLIKHRRITSTELTRFFLDRIKRYSDTLNCLVSLTEEIAMGQAAKADKEIASGKYRGPLHGIPYGLKDLFAVKGTATTWGAAPFRKQVIEHNSYVYTKLLESGAVLVAKFSLGSLAMGDLWFGGKTRNPWNLNTGSGGSSAGSAAAVAAGLVPFAIGTETWGSIVNPASTCGVTGLRPTFGSVSRTGGMTLAWSLDKIGPICRSAEDAAMIFDKIHGADGQDLAAVNHSFKYKDLPDIKGIRIGYLRSDFKDTDSALIPFLKIGAKLIPVDLATDRIQKLDPLNLMLIVVSAESSAAFDQFTRSNLDDELTGQTQNDWPTQFRVGRMISAVDYINANRHRYLLMTEVEDALANVDVVIAKTFSDQLHITNLTGHPALCMPSGFDEQGLPTSITLIGKLYGEATLLAAGKLYQRVTTGNKKYPPAFR